MYKRSGFTLLEIIVVIIIIGILATLGFVQYARVVEKSRRAEAASVLATMRSMATAWHEEGGHATAYPASADINTLLNVPNACAGTHYFAYTMASGTGTGTATRCTADGKDPQGTNADVLTLTVNGVKGSVPAGLW